MTISLSGLDDFSLKMALQKKGAMVKANVVSINWLVGAAVAVAALGGLAA
jgi:hypothetical protein